MARDAVFLDTSGLVGHFLRQDSLHAAATYALTVLARAGTPLVCSDWVLTEFLNSASPIARRASAGSFVRTLLTDPMLTMVEASHVGLLEALDLFESRPDKDWSIVDCSSILICKARGIRRVLTHDRHFRQAGLDVLL